MPRLRSSNIKFLNSISRVLDNNKDVKDKTDKIIDLYTEGKIAQLRTAMNIIVSLNSSDEKLKNKGIKAYNKKYNNLKQHHHL
jgi:predicted HTH domain antitoxin